jgi:hypothetical protein
MLHDTTMLGAEQFASPAPLDVYQGLSGPYPSEHDIPRQPLATPFLAPKGEWFDEGFDFREPEGEAFTGAVLEMIGAVEVRDRARKPVDEANHRTIVRKLLANGFRASHYHKPSLIAVQLKAASYKGRAAWLSGRAMARAIRLLEKAGLIEVNRGQWGGSSTTFSVTEAFLVASAKAHVSQQSLFYRPPPERLIRVYRTNSDDGETVDFEATAETRQWSDRLDAFNRFLAEQEIGIALTQAQADRLTTRMNEERPHGTPPLIRPDLIKTDIFRQFNGGAFEQGGRLYGGWWINCPKELRPLITINGKPTVELDYSGCAIRMLYHENKEECEGDPYFLDAIDACERKNDLGEGHYREDVKRMTQALINGREGGYAERARLERGRSFRPYFKRPALMAMIREKHRTISHTFQTGAWGRLQRADSDIALEIITNLKAQGIVALPVHDSFLVMSGDEPALRKEMIDCYFNRFGFNPVIKGIGQ